MYQSHLTIMFLLLSDTVVSIMNIYIYIYMFIDSKTKYLNLITFAINKIY